ncbi:MAG: hypothetical protein P8Y42_21105 [Exilibacterium sp.]
MLRLIIAMLLTGVTAFAWALPESLLNEQSRLNTLQKDISDTETSLTEDKFILEQLALMLSGAREQLAPLSESRSDVINKHQIRLLTILIDRQQRKLKRLEQERGETQALIAGLDKKAADLHREYGRIQTYAKNLGAAKKKQKTRITKIQLPSGESGPERLARVREGWPYLSSGSRECIDFARRKLENLSLRRKKGEVASSVLREVELNSRKHIGPIDMEYLGDGLFSTIATVKAGRQAFTLFGVDYWHTIPAWDNNVDYRIIYDISSISNPKLYLFRESVLEEIIPASTR